MTLLRLLTLGLLFSGLAGSAPVRAQDERPPAAQALTLMQPELLRIDRELAAQIETRRRNHFAFPVALAGTGVALFLGSAAYAADRTLRIWTKLANDKPTRQRREQRSIATRIGLAGLGLGAVGALWLAASLPRYRKASERVRALDHEKRELLLHLSPSLSSHEAGLNVAFDF